MSAVIGRWVKTFAEATHALPDGMHANADYPFMSPEIVSIRDDEVTVRGRDGRTATAVITSVNGQEVFSLEQLSTFEKLYGRPPTRFTFWPFAGEKR